MKKEKGKIICTHCGEDINEIRISYVTGGFRVNYHPNCAYRILMPQTVGYKIT